MMAAAAAEAVGATRLYVCPARDQLFLMPVSMRDWLDEGHLAFFVLDVVGELDTSALHRRPGGCPGRPPYEPEMMLGLLLYAYCCGIRSSRRIEAHCRTDAAFRVICGGLVPDHATLARFVVEHERALEGLFVEGVRLCAAAGLADLSVVALDGTKIAADASLARNRGADWIRREITELMALTAEDQPLAALELDGLAGIEPALEISTATGRLARLRAALEVIGAEDAAVAETAARQIQAALAQAEHGRHQIGRKPKEPQAALARAELDHTVARERVENLQAEKRSRLPPRQTAARTSPIPTAGS
jgi:transposase